MIYYNIPSHNQLRHTLFQDGLYSTNLSHYCVKDKFLSFGRFFALLLVILVVRPASLHSEQLSKQFQELNEYSKYPLQVLTKYSKYQVKSIPRIDHPLASSPRDNHPSKQEKIVQRALAFRTERDKKSSSGSHSLVVPLSQAQFRRKFPTIQLLLSCSSKNNCKQVQLS